MSYQELACLVLKTNVYQRMEQQMIMVQEIICFHHLHGQI